MRPRPKLGRWSTYTVLGFTGYVLATVLGAVLARLWDFTLAERLVALLAPGTAFIVVVTLATYFKGREWIVFYQALYGAIAAVLALGLALDLRVWRLLDTTVLGIGAFLVLGRLGCFHVACCHGRIARRGVVYGPEHVAVGLWPRLEGRPVFPIQLVESGLALALVIAALACSHVPGTAALGFAVGYALVRFVLELYRGDHVRPTALGLSEAQWWSLATAAICVAARPTWWTLAALAVLAVATGVLVATRRARELVSPAHLHDLDTACRAAAAEHAQRQTGHGVAVSCHPLDDHRLDWVLSSTHRAWSLDTARTIAGALWLAPEVVPGRTAGVIHIIVASSR